MIRLQRSFATLAAGALLATSTVAVAGTRPGSSVPAVTPAVTAKMVTRQSEPTKDQQKLAGAPSLLFILLGAGALGAFVALVSKGRNDSRG